MKITAQEEYGLRCLLQVALQSEGAKLASLENIAKAEGLTSDYAAKLLMTLRNANLVDSIRGKSGGYKLSRPPEKIYLDEVIRALSGDLFEDNACSLFTAKESECVHIECCTLRSMWISISQLLCNALGTISLKTLLDKDDLAKKLLVIKEYSA